MRARECRLYWALSIIAPSVNVLGRTRRKPSTIRGAAPDVVIGQSTAAPAGARPSYGGGKRFARLSYVDAHVAARFGVAIVGTHSISAYLSDARLSNAPRRKNSTFMLAVEGRFTRMPRFISKIRRISSTA